MPDAARARDFQDPRIPNRDECVLRYLLDRWAAERPDRAHNVVPDGSDWSFAWFLYTSRCV